MTTATASSEPIVYPDSDGQPMAENTLQFQWIVTIQGGLDTVFAHDPNVFVAGDLLWYPVQGKPKIRQAPDIMVVFGRHKGYRGSYRQWEEGGIAPQVVFEILSPGNRFGEMQRKEDFYDQYGVEEYYVYDPETVELFGWRRDGGVLRRIAATQGYVSPLLGIRFELGDDLRIVGPDGRPFATYVELAQQRADAERGKQEAELAKQQAEQARQQAEQAKQQAEQAKQQAERDANEQLQRLRAQIKALGGEPEL
jgi:Uma2 family endonuclease